MFAENAPHEEELTGFNVCQNKESSVQQILNTMSTIPENHPKMTEDDVTEWLQQDSDLPGVQELTNAHIIECPKSAERRPGPGRTLRDQGATCALA